MPRIIISDKDLKRGARLKKFRKESKLSREDLGRIAGGFPQGSVYNWEEKGGGIPNKAIVCLHKFGCNMFWLLTGEGPMEKEKGESDA